MNQATQAIGTQQPAFEAAPAAEEFPAAPSSWYLLCRNRDLGKEPLGVEILGRRLAVFRSGQGVAAIEADCSHMGADLSRGRVVQGRLQCPFHGWEYGSHGRCMRIPAQAKIPPFACQQSFAVAERHGLLFAYLSPDPGEPRFELPELLPPTGRELLASRPHEYAMECPWYLFAANGFDLQHFALVHDRELVGEPQVDCPGPFARRIRFTSRVVGRSAADRLIRNLAGDTVDVAITAWAGNLVSVVAQFARATSRVLFSTQPLVGGRTSARLLVFKERGPWYRRCLDPLDLWIRRRLTWTFIEEDTRRIHRAEYRPGAFVAADRIMIDYFHWLAALPHSQKET